MATAAGKGMARQAVMGAMAARDWNPAKLADEAGVDYGTVGDFLNGKRWPKVGTMGKLERALGWTPGTLAGIGEELIAPPEPETVSASSEDEDTLLFRRPEGLTDQQWAERKDRMRAGWEWELGQADSQR